MQYSISTKIGSNNKCTGTGTSLGLCKRQRLSCSLARSERTALQRAKVFFWAGSPMRWLSFKSSSVWACPKTTGVYFEKREWPWRHGVKCRLSPGSTISNANVWSEDASLELRGILMLYFSHMESGFIKQSQIDSINSGICGGSGCSPCTLQSCSAWPSTHFPCVFLKLTSTLLFKRFMSARPKSPRQSNSPYKEKVCSQG